MRTLFLCLSLFFVTFIAAGRTELRAQMYGAIFHGKQIWLEVKQNPDGTRNDIYRDNEGNPLSELERSFLKGQEKLHPITYASTLLTLIYLTLP